VGLDVRVAACAEDLLAPLLAWLDAPRTDSFATDLVVVPNAGVRSWVGTAVADHARILAGVEFVFPAELRARLLDLPDAAADPWRPERLAWDVLAVVTGPDAPRGLPWTGPVARPWSLARRIADLLDRAATQRPELIAGWAQGDDGGWQAEVWRLVRARVGAASPAELLVGPGEPRPATRRLPDRLAVVGIGDLAPATATLLRRCAEDRDVLVLAPVPSPALLGRPARVAPSDPLLATWGRAAVAAAGVLDGLGVQPLDVAPDSATGATSAGRAGTHQLGRLREGIAADRAGTPVARDVRDGGRGGDGSIQVHACHGLVRQLEVLRDALLHALEDDHGLEPRDVLVLCPDLRRVAPLVGPILGAEVAGHRLPVRVADRSALGPTPVVGALEALLDVAAGRAERDEVLALLMLPVVRTALGLEDDDLELLARAADELDLRWGVDAAHRERWGYPDGVASGTWREGMDRLLAGVLLHPSGDVVAGIAPAADVRAQDVPVLARLADALRALGDLVGLAGPARPMSGWGPALLAVVDRWLVPPRSDDDVHHAQAVAAGQLRAAVVSLAADAAAAGIEAPLELLEVRAALLDRVASGGGGGDPRGGSVTVASLTPLRGVPARIVAVVDVGAIASPPPADADDLLAASPLPGERDPRDEPRAGLLDAVLAARSRLIMTCDGQDVRTGAELPLPTAVEELLDAVPDVGGAAPLVVRHPRHLADPRALGGDAALSRLTGGRPWTFQPWAHRAAQALASGRGAEPGLRAVAVAPSVAPSDPPTVLTLDALRDALARPAHAWLRHGLGLRLPSEVELPPRTLPVWLGRRDDGLVRWQLGDELLRHVESGGDAERWLAARPARGGLPPGRLGRRILDEVHEEVAAIHAAADVAAGPGAVVSLPLAVDVGGVRLEGMLEVRGDRVVDAGVQSDHPSHVVRAWLGLLLARVAGAEGIRGATVVRRGGEDGPVVRHLDVAAEAAPTALATAVDLALRARSGPLALLPRTAWRLADPGRSEGAVAEDLARDLRAPEVLLVHGPLTPDDLTALASGPAEDGLPGDGPAAHRVAAVLVGAVAASTGGVPWSGPTGDDA
jgi:exodeoxyribonuclease V gamma subunit